MLKVLLITSETVLERMLNVTLTINGLSLTTVSHVSDAIAKLKTSHFNFLLVDPFFYDTVPTIWERGLSLPTLVFMTEPKLNKIPNVEFLSDPFNFPALKNKMNSMFRSHHGLQETMINKGPLKIDLAQQMVTIRERMIGLGKMEFAILVSLARKAGNVVSPENLRKDLEAQGQFFNTAIYHHIKELKRKLKENTGELYIKKVTGRGYQLLLDH